jgi:signal transduction histidine kinase
MERLLPHSPEMTGTASVAIISDDPEFARMLMDRWEGERFVPSFTLMGSDFGDGACSAGWELAIVALSVGDKLSRVLEAVQSCAAVLYVAENSALAQFVRTEYARVVVLRNHEGWADIAVPLCCEMLRRVEAMARLLQIERTLAENEQDALLGRYMLDMRHNVNNALTSVLGNAELLLLEPGALSAEFREQIDTIHNMALRMHEIMQRFTSLETEMRFVDSSPRREPVRATATALMMKSSA